MPMQSATVTLTLSVSDGEDTGTLLVKVGTQNQGHGRRRRNAGVDKLTGGTGAASSSGGAGTDMAADFNIPEHPRRLGAEPLSE
jgi:hypothetical protein